MPRPLEFAGSEPLATMGVASAALDPVPGQHVLLTALWPGGGPLGAATGITGM